jgi:hypothetical protein
VAGSSSKVEVERRGVVDHSLSAILDGKTVKTTRAKRYSVAVLALLGVAESVWPSSSGIFQKVASWVSVIF